MRDELKKKYRIHGVSDDSRLTKRGDIFFAIKGARTDGHKFISSAVKKGAVTIVVDRTSKINPVLENRAKFICVDDPKQELARFASDFYGNPSKRLKMIGITGTNGKTTTAYLLSEILNRARRETATIGTISYRWKDKIREAKNTTPGILKLQEMLSEMVQDNVKCCVMEVSSHSLGQDRVSGVNFNTAIVTNITSEHLDYHKTYKNYVEAKSRLFRSLKSKSCAVLNMDDENFNVIRRKTRARIVTYGLKNRAQVRADQIRCDFKGTEFTLKTPKGSCRIETQLVGIFNVYNCLAAVSAALQEGISLKTIKEAIRDFKGAEGRLQAVNVKTAFKVFIDYAHTDNALESVLLTLRKIAKNRLIVVFGCGGDRDRAKRPLMGNAASRYSDYMIITSDNPRSESPSFIAKEIEKGITKSFKSYKVILDRYEAIKEALRFARSGDIVLVAGKGHEKYQVIGQSNLPFCDLSVTKEILSQGQIK